MDLETPPTAVIDAKNNSFGKVLAVLAVIAIIVVVTFLLVGKKTPSKTSVNKTQTASTSASVASGSCTNGQQYSNDKQGYNVCYPQNWKASALSVSAMLVGFGAGTIINDYPGDISVQVSDDKVDVLVQDTTSNSSKFEYGKTLVDKVSSTQVIYTRSKSDPLYEAHKVGIDTFLNQFGRTYAIVLNTNPETQSADEKVYDNFLASWQFVSTTGKPPWSDSHNILVYSPWTNEKVTNPIHLTGEGSAFEAVISIRVKDTASHILLQTTTQAQSGTERSPFSANLTFEKPSTKKGTLEVYTSSPADGSEQDKVVIPIEFP